MAEWDDPTPFQLEALHEAMLFAFPSHFELDQLLTLKLGRSYAQLAPFGADYTQGMTAVLVKARAAGWLTELVGKAMKYRPNSPLLRVLDRTVGLTRLALPAGEVAGLEDLVREATGTQELMPWLGKLESAGNRTCRIEYPVNTARGTGWLVGRDLLLTNWHVIDEALDDGTWDAREIVCRFDYAVVSDATHAGSEVRLADAWLVDSSSPAAAELGIGPEGPTDQTLDFALLRLSRPVADDVIANGGKRGSMTIAADQGLPKTGDIVFVVQHPDGLPIKLAAGDIRPLPIDALRIFHTANTRGGSSGAMVLNMQLQVVALHHAGDLLYNRGSIGAPAQNQAIPIGLIATRLAAEGQLL